VKKNGRKRPQLFCEITVNWFVAQTKISFSDAFFSVQNLSETILRRHSMNESLDLKGLERKAFVSYQQDGLLDLFLGMLLLVWGLTMEPRLGGMGGVWFVVLFPIFLLARRRITYPRLGYAQFTKERRNRRRLVALFTATALLGLMVAFLWSSQSFPGLRDWLHRYIVIFFGGLIAAVLLFKAGISGIRRLYLYATVILISFAAAQWSSVHFRYSFIISGAVILISGVVVLTRFLRRYPVRQRETADAEER
jgi:hypothetical protein